MWASPCSVCKGLPPNKATPSHPPLRPDPHDVLQPHVWGSSASPDPPILHHHGPKLWGRCVGMKTRTRWSSLLFVHELVAGQPSAKLRWRRSARSASPASGHPTGGRYSRRSQGASRFVHSFMRGSLAASVFRFSGREAPLQPRPLQPGSAAGTVHQEAVPAPPTPHVGCSRNLL